MEDKKKQTPENFIKEIRRKTKRIFTSEQKITIVMEALRGENTVAEICRKYSIHASQFYSWNKEFLEAGKKRLAGDTTREATKDEVGYSGDIDPPPINWIAKERRRPDKFTFIFVSLNFPLLILYGAPYALVDPILHLQWLHLQ